MSKRATWDLALLVAGIVYLELVLFQQIEFPLFGLWLVVVSGHELIGSTPAAAESFGSMR